jgi:hypothetical protein
MEFLTINLGNILTIATFLIGGLSFAYTIRSDVKVTSVRLTAVERELSDLRKVVVEIARQEERLNSMDSRMLAQGVRLDQIVSRVDGLINRERNRGSKSE